MKLYEHLKQNTGKGYYMNFLASHYQTSFMDSVYYLIFNGTLSVIRICIDPNESDRVYIE